jgi:beta-phosphoglucomutase-like phosphatase (HAD superfamily)
VAGKAVCWRRRHARVVQQQLGLRRRRRQHVLAVRVPGHHSEPTPALRHTACALEPAGCVRVEVTPAGVGKNALEEEKALEETALEEKALEEKAW